MTKVLELALLGDLQLRLGGSSLSEPASAKARALLCYLATTVRPHSRHAIAELLWGSLPESDARRNLRGVLMVLRTHFEPYLLVNRTTLEFNREVPYSLDVELFRAKLAQAPGATPSARALEEAISLYRGDFLCDVHVRQAPAFDEWVSAQRLQLRDMAVEACLSLAEILQDRGDYGSGIEHARHMTVLDPLREDGWRQLMLLLTLNGQRSAALTQYEASKALLRADLGVEPSSETELLYDRIRSGKLSAQQGARISTPSGGRTSLKLADASNQHSTIDLPTFVAGPPVVHPKHFFGRERELTRLFNMLRRLPLQNAAIIGPRRSGKTSLLHFLKNVVDASPSELRPDQRADWLPAGVHINWIFVDFQDARLGGREPLMQYLLEEMRMPRPDVLDLESFLDVVIDRLLTPTVVLFDEIGVALQRYEELDDAFWESLRSLATNHVSGRLGFVLTAPERTDQLAHHSGFGSPFFNIFGYTAHLGPISDEGARSLIASSPIPFAERDVEWILRTSEKWPILLQILCRERLVSLEENEQGDSWRSEGERQLAPFLYLCGRNDV